MTAKRDFKRRVRQRQARTGESYVTARRHVLAARPHEAPQDEGAASEAGTPAEAGTTPQVEAAPAEASPAAANINSDAGAVAADTAAANAPAIPVTELVDVSEEASRLGFLCRVVMFPALAERVEPARVLARLRDLLFQTTGDPQTELLSQVALTGRGPRRSSQTLYNLESLRLFARRARAGLGGTFEDGSMFVLYVAGRDGIVPVLIPILCSVAQSPAWPNASLVLSAIDDMFPEAELIKGRLALEPWDQVGAQLATVLARVAPRPWPGPTLFVLHEGRRYPVTQNEFLIGRDSQAVHLTIKDGLVSRHHAAVIHRNGAYYFKDLGSTHGTFYKGMQIDNKRIDEGDTFQIGDHELRFTFEPDE